MSEMSRGEMIRRLDDVSDRVHDGLATGPLSRRERDALAYRLTTLLPVVAARLPSQEDRQAAHSLLLPNPDARHEKGATRGSYTGWGAVRVHPRRPRAMSMEQFDDVGGLRAAFDRRKAPADTCLLTGASQSRLTDAERPVRAFQSRSGRGQNQAP